MLRTPRRLRAFLAQGSIVKLKTERRQLQSFSFDFTFQVEALPSSSSFVDVSCQGSRGHVPLLCALKRIRGFPPPGDTSQESTGEVWREGEKRQQVKKTGGGKASHLSLNVCMLLLWEMQPRAQTKDRVKREEEGTLTQVYAF
ncbi:hypothetical protein J1605_002891 [Eschrichtius robustus]|uniref:Uncharacterized protein n=1 Tax=Eschrichtius robustus TaxID=9764 RepID=A0AB34HU42_ESCRO|nr:hypothetical protein J1605_002891 [Eschrichtius robustus]